LVRQRLLSGDQSAALNVAEGSGCAAQQFELGILKRSLNLMLPDYGASPTPMSQPSDG
jgi:hypothetical protein